METRAARARQTTGQSSDRTDRQEETFSNSQSGLDETGKTKRRGQGSPAAGDSGGTEPIWDWEGWKLEVGGLRSLNFDDPDAPSFLASSLSRAQAVF